MRAGRGELVVEFLADVIGALAAGALAKANEVGGRVVVDTYDTLRAITTGKLGKEGAVRDVEEDPRSEAAQAALAEALAKAGFANDPELGRHAATLRTAMAGFDDSGRAAIEVGDITGKVNVLVSHLVASGRIQIGNLRAETGDATLAHVTAGTPTPKKG